jgi:hypothetical protein
MVFWCRYSSINFLTSSISSCVRDSNHLGNMFSAPGRSSIAWSQIVCLGNLCNSCSENILLCCWYLAGMLGSDLVVTVVKLIITLPMKYWLQCTSQGLFTDQEVKQAFFILEALRMTGNYDESIHPHFQSIFSCVAANQKYPNIALLSPRSVRKKCSGVRTLPVCTSRSV